MSTPSLSYFRVGDRVFLTKPCAKALIGTKVTITKIVPTDRFPIQFVTADGKKCSHSASYFLYSHLPMHELESPINNNQENKPMVTAKEIRDLELNDDDKLLQDAGLEKADGVQTPEADRIVLDKMYKKLRKEIIEDIKKVNTAKEK